MQGTFLVKPSTKDVSRLIRVGSGAIAVELAIIGLIGMVDYVMENSHVRYKIKLVDGRQISHCEAQHQDKIFKGTLHSVGNQWCQAVRDYDNPAETFTPFDHSPHHYRASCKEGAGSTIVSCAATEATLSYDEIAEKILADANAGKPEAVNFVQTVADGLATQQAKEQGWEATQKPVQSVGSKPKDETKPDNPPRKEPEKPKTCSQTHPGIPQCRYQYGFKYYSSKDSAQRALGFSGFKTQSQHRSYKGTCKGYSTHWNLRDPKKGSDRVGSMANCNCCNDMGKPPQIETWYRGF